MEVATELVDLDFEGSVPSRTFGQVDVLAARVAYGHVSGTAGEDCVGSSATSRCAGTSLPSHLRWRCSGDDGRLRSEGTCDLVPRVLRFAGNEEEVARRRAEEQLEDAV